MNWKRMGSAARWPRLGALLVALVAPPMITGAARAEESPAKGPSPPSDASGDQDDDIVTTADGRRLIGRVLRQEPTRLVVLRTRDGRELTLWGSEVREVDLSAPSAERLRRAPNPPLPEEPSAPPLSDQSKRRWLERGGETMSYEVRAEVTAIVPAKQSYLRDGSCATGTGLAPVSIYGQSQSGRGSGLGGGFGVRASYMRLLLPPEEGKTAWWAFALGTGLDLNVLHVRLPNGLPQVDGELCTRVEKQSPDLETEDVAALLMQIPFRVGAHMGVGHFSADDTWRGLVFGVAWAPAYSYMKAHGRDGAGTFSFLGAELSLDWAPLDAGSSKVAPPPHLRAATTFLAPTADGAPWLMSVSCGAVWY